MAVLPDGVFVGNEITFALDVAGGTNYVAADCQRDFSIDMQSETIDGSCKGSGKWGVKLDGNKDTTLSLNANIQQGGTTSDGVFFSAFVASTRFTYQASHDAGTVGPSVDDFEYSGTAIITGMTLNFPFNDIAAMDITAGGIGAIARTVIT